MSIAQIEKCSPQAAAQLGCELERAVQHENEERGIAAAIALLTGIAINIARIAEALAPVEPAYPAPE